MLRITQECIDRSRRIEWLRNASCIVLTSWQIYDRKHNIDIKLFSYYNSINYFPLIYIYIYQYILIYHFTFHSWHPSFKIYIHLVRKFIPSATTCFPDSCLQRIPILYSNASYHRPFTIVTSGHVQIHI